MEEMAQKSLLMSQIVTHVCGSHSLRMEPTAEEAACTVGAEGLYRNTKQGEQKGPL